jgi:hypothetical protein
MIMAGMAWGAVCAAQATADDDAPAPPIPAATTTAAPGADIGPRRVQLPAAAARPDLRPQIRGPAEGHAGQDISAAIRLTITNLGDAPAGAGFPVEIGLLMAPAEGPAMYRALVRWASPYPLAPHETRQYRITGAVIPENFQWGTNLYRLCVRVDPANRLGAVNRLDKSACTEIRILPEREEGEIR